MLRLWGIDTFSHWVEIKPFRVEDQDAKVLFLFEWILRHGIPNRVLTDRDPHFDAQFVASFLAKFGIVSSIGTSDHPHRTGLVQRSVQTIRNLCSKMTLSVVPEWDICLPAVAMVMRTESSTWIFPALSVIWQAFSKDS